MIFNKYYSVVYLCGVALGTLFFAGIYSIIFMDLKLLVSVLFAIILALLVGILPIGRRK